MARKARRSRARHALAAVSKWRRRIKWLRRGIVVGSVLASARRLLTKGRRRGPKDPGSGPGGGGSGRPAPASGPRSGAGLGAPAPAPEPADVVTPVAVGTRSPQPNGLSPSGSPVEVSGRSGRSGLQRVVR